LNWLLHILIIKKKIYEFKIFPFFFKLKKDNAFLNYYFFSIDPFLNSNFTTNKNLTFGEFSNPTEISKPNYVYVTTKEIPIEAYFN